MARIFLLVDLLDFFSDLGSRGRKKKSSENDQLTGHSFNMSRTNNKISKVNQQSV